MKRPGYEANKAPTRPLRVVDLAATVEGGNGVERNYSSSSQGRRVSFIYAETIQGRDLFHSARVLVRKLFKCKNCSRAGSKQGNTVWALHTMHFIRVHTFCV